MRLDECREPYGALGEERREAAWVSEGGGRRLPCSFPLQAQPDEAVLEGKEGASHRDRDHKPKDIGVLAWIEHLPELVDKPSRSTASASDQVCDQGCATGSPQLAHPSAL